MHLKMSSGKWQPFFLGLNVLRFGLARSQCLTQWWQESWTHYGVSVELIGLNDAVCTSVIHWVDSNPNDLICLRDVMMQMLPIISWSSFQRSISCWFIVMVVFGLFTIRYLHYFIMVCFLIYGKTCLSIFIPQFLFVMMSWFINNYIARCFVICAILFMILLFLGSLLLAWINLNPSMHK